MIFNRKILILDIKNRQYKEVISENEMLKIIGLCRSTFWRLKNGKPITMETFIKCITWVGNDVTRYFKKK